MNPLTDSEISNYVRERNRYSGIDGITVDFLRGVDLDQVPEVEIHSNCRGKCMHINGKCRYTYQDFTPEAGTAYAKPSFAGRQVLMGRKGRKLYFSNGRWFQGGFCLFELDRLTDSEIAKYVREKDTYSGVDRIPAYFLKGVDLDKVPEVEIHRGSGGTCMHINGECRYTHAHFNPKSGSIHSEPSFEGRQVLLGQVNRKLYFSDGRWFPSEFCPQNKYFNADN